MLAAVITAILFALSAVFGAGSARQLGPLTANATRLTFASFALWIIVFIFARHALPQGEALAWLAISGVVGFGLGDIALYLAFVRLGSRLTLLIVFSSAPAFALLGEWATTGILPLPIQLAFIALIGIGLFVALLPGRDRDGACLNVPGMWWALLAGAGQAGGAVLSRLAVTPEAREVSEGLAAGLAEACIRVLGGLPIAIIAAVIARDFRKVQPDAGQSGAQWRAALPWLIGSALCGPVLGVGCFQWSLFVLPGGIALAVVAASPLIATPLTRLIEGERVKARSVLGSMIAVAGVAALYLYG